MTESNVTGSLLQEIIEKIINMFFKYLLTRIFLKNYIFIKPENIVVDFTKKNFLFYEFPYNTSYFCRSRDSVVIVNFVNVSDCF